MARGMDRETGAGERRQPARSRLATIRMSVRVWRRREYARLICIGMAACAAIAIGWAGGISSSGPDAPWFAALFFAVAALLILHGTTRMRRVMRMRGADAIETLLELLDALSRLDAVLRPDALALLRALLPLVDDCDAPDFTPSRIRTLVLLLITEGTPLDVRMLAMSALRYVADETAAAQIGALANGPAQTRDERALRQRASRCLPDLLKRLNARRSAGTLVRPAEAPPDASLLRPAEGGPVGEQALLLRPASNSEQNNHGL